MLYRAGILLLAAASAVLAQAPRVRVLVIYHSGTGNTEQMAQALGEGARGLDGVEVKLRRFGEETQQELTDADAIALGSPVYMGDVAVEARQAAMRWANDFGLWESRALQNKAGAVFATGAFPSNGKEITMLSLAQTLWQFGAVLVTPYGSIGASATTARPDPGVDDAEKKIARDLGRRLAEVALRLKAGAAALE
ncbi:MAG: flavodoxin domain-containing protein [Acidobacteria bacterium]|nr:flavodoxin domain-containing protein [Acidobacteriota bacterium]